MALGYPTSILAWSSKMFVIAVTLFGLFVTGLVFGIIFWFIAMYHFVAMIANKRSETEHKWWAAGFMTVYIPSALTDVGRMHRQRGFSYLAGFFVSLGIAGAAALAMQLIGTKPP
jgi:hypothetical protein